MKAYQAKSSALIEAPPEQVYAIIADYRDGHPHILPKPYFLSLDVEQGGVGAGTIINFKMRVMGKTQTFRAAVSEPEPGRVLVESNFETPETSASESTFTLVPREQGRQTEVTITTEGKTRSGGLLGAVERFLTTKMLERIFVKELALLATVAKERQTTR